jgi:hypothetical protein
MDTTDQFLLDFECSDDEEYVFIDAEGEEQPAGSERRRGGEGTAASSGDDAAPAGTGAALELETDPLRLAQRQKQIAFGKNTEAYRNYVQLVPK